MCFLTGVKSGAEQLKGLESPSFQDESSPCHELKGFLMISIVSNKYLVNSSKIIGSQDIWAA